MTTKHEIEIQGLPEGWRPVAYRIPKNKEMVLTDNGNVENVKGVDFPCLVVEKIKPRRIILEESPEPPRKVKYGEWLEDVCGNMEKWNHKSFDSKGIYKVWKEVKE